MHWFTPSLTHTVPILLWLKNIDIASHFFWYGISSIFDILLYLHIRSNMWMEQEMLGFQLYYSFEGKHPDKYILSRFHYLSVDGIYEGFTNYSLPLIILADGLKKGLQFLPKNAKALWWLGEQVYAVLWLVFTWSPYTWSPVEITPVLTTFCGLPLCALLLCSMTHYDITMAHDVAI